MPQMQPPGKRLLVLDFVGAVAGQARGSFARAQTVFVGLEAGDRRRGLVARDQQQIARQMFRRGFRGAAAGERVQQRMATEVLECTAAAQKTAEPMA